MAHSQGRSAVSDGKHPESFPVHFDLGTLLVFKGRSCFSEVVVINVSLTLMEVNKRSFIQYTTLLRAQLFSEGNVVSREGQASAKG